MVAHLWPGIKTDYHGRLAATLEASGGGDDEAIAIHFDAAGDPKSAGRYYYKAGEKAAAALAFNHAAGLFQRALDLSTVTGEEPGELRSKLAEALANAGRSAEAAVLYREAAQRAEAANRLELERRAAYYFAASGHIQQGREAFARILAEVGLRLPSSPAEAIRTILWSRLQLMARGLNFTPRPESEVSKIDLRTCRHRLVRCHGVDDGGYPTVRQPWLAAGCCWPSRLGNLTGSRGRYCWKRSLEAGRRASAGPPST